MNLNNKVAVITGASSGIGQAIALKLGKEGVNTVLLARSEDKLRSVASEIEKLGSSALPLKTDITDENNVRESIEHTLLEFKRLDILVNNAGLGIFKNTEEMGSDEWREQLSVMLDGTFFTCKYSLPHMYRQKQGHVIAISSLWAKKGCKGCTAYTAAKFGTRGFMESLRIEARQHNVKVTNIMPGTVDTPFFQKADYSVEQDMSGVLKAEDVAETVLYALKLPERAVCEEVVLQALHPPY